MTTKLDLPEIAAPTTSDHRATTEYVTMRDGVRLATDIYLPSAGIDQAPAVLIRLPYDKTGRYTFIPQIGEHFAAHGFVCVTQDVRGKYASEGERALFENEAADGWDTVEWITAQPWSDGVVGTWGDSYYGFTQWALASAQHPAHRAMVPRVTGHRFLDMRPGGGHPTRTLLEWVVDAWALPELIVDGGVDDRIGVSILDSVHPALEDGRRLLKQFLDVSENPDPLLQKVFPAGNPAAALQIPALHTGGWFDNLQHWQLDDWYTSLTSPASEHQYLRMGTNDHEDYRWREPGTPLTADFGADPDALAAHIPSLLAEPIAFFNHYLRGHTGRWDAPTVAYEQARAGRRVAAEWPPKRVINTSLTLTAYGKLLPESGNSPAGELSWTHNPRNPVPHLLRSEWDQNRPGLPDESGLHDRVDVAVFTTDPFDTVVDLTGRVIFRGTVEADIDRTTVIARLLDVNPAGEARLILGNAATVTADGATEFQIRLGDTAYRLPAGHRLRLAISSTMHGLYDAAPTGTDPVLHTLQLDAARLRYQVDPRR